MTKLSRLALLGCALLAVATAGCDRSGGSETATPEAASPVQQPEATPTTATADWTGSYTIRGTLGEGQTVNGTMQVQTLAEGAPALEETRRRVQRTYPSYTGPFYQADLDAGALRGSFTCAHGPASTPPLVCEPSGEVAGVEHATLVITPDGKAVLTGSHGEGVSVESGRFSWERASTP